MLYHIGFFLWVLSFPGCSSIPDDSAVSDERTRIIGGTTCSESDSYNFMVAIFSEYRVPHCGGSLLSESWVLTAAHCLSESKSSYVLAGVAATENVLLVSKKWQKRYVASFYRHQDYNSETYENDIGLLRVKQPIYRSERIDYVRLRRITQDLTERCPEVLAIGWGALDHVTRKKPRNLQCASLKVVTLEECRTKHLKHWLTKVVCVRTSGASPSFGDSGGPLMCGDVQVGVTAWVNVKDSSKPAVYSRVDEYLDFIYDTMRDARLGSVTLLRFFRLMLICAFMLIIIF